ncbi:helix-turn-helix domain-containing protein [Mycoplasmatota bacterium WC44]
MLIRNIACNITRLRNSMNMSQKELAEALYVTHQAVSKWENGKSIPSIAVMVLLTKLFEVPVDTLLSNPEDKANFKTILSNYERTYCMTSLLNGELDVDIMEVLYLLSKEERELILISIINKEYEVDILEFWPLLNLKERLILLRGLIRNKDSETIFCLRGMLRKSELSMINKNMKEKMYEYK